MTIYHITENYIIEKCVEYSNCTDRHFDSLYDALRFLDKKLDMDMIDSLDEVKINKYIGEINYNSGFTIHYESDRVFREMELIRLLGEGKRIEAFIVDKGNNDKQIHELLDNAILNVYSFDTHKKITLFAPKPERIIFLYNSIGEFPPDWIIEKSELNVRKGYNEIFSSKIGKDTPTSNRPLDR